MAGLDFGFDSLSRCGNDLSSSVSTSNCSSVLSDCTSAHSIVIAESCMRRMFLALAGLHGCKIAIVDPTSRSLAQTVALLLQRSSGTLQNVVSRMSRSYETETHRHQLANSGFRGARAGRRSVDCVVRASVHRQRQCTKLIPTACRGLQSEWPRSCRALFRQQTRHRQARRSTQQAALGCDTERSS